MVELTCFDGLFTDEHESDIDCGGPHCKSCNESQVSQNVSDISCLAVPIITCLF